MNKELIIYTECGNKIGFGHLSRCCALYDYAVEAGVNTLLVIDTDAQKIASLAHKRYMVANWRTGNAVNFAFGKYAVVDSYLAPLEVYKQLSKVAKRVGFFDDDCRMDYPAGIVINPAGSSNDYGEHRVLSGAAFCAVRKEFAKQGKIKIKQTVSDILICLGAGSERITAEALTIIKKFFLQGKANFHIVVENPCMQFDKCERARIYSGLDEKQMAALMRGMDFAIVSGGQTMLELSVLGIPFICIQTASNQHKNISLVQQAGLIKNCINANELSLLTSALIEATDFEQRKRINANSAVFDGNGTNRILEALLA